MNTLQVLLQVEQHNGRTFSPLGDCCFLKFVPHFVDKVKRRFQIPPG